MSNPNEEVLGPVFGSQRASTMLASKPFTSRRGPLPAAALRELEFDGRPANAPRAAADEIEDGAVIGVAAIVDGLRNGTDAQRSLILFEVQQVVSNSGDFALKTLVPVICEQVTSWSHDLQICAAEALVGMQVAKLPHDQAMVLVVTAFAVLGQNSDADSFRAWGEILVQVLPHAHWSQSELHSILQLLDDQYSLSASNATSRAGRGSAGSSASRPGSPRLSREDLTMKLAARIIGPVGVSASPELTTSVLLPRALNLAKESSIDVRGMVVESLAYIGAGVDISTVERLIWPTLSTLVRDSNARLRAATLRTIARISSAHRSKTPLASLFTDLLPPVFIRECHYLRRHASADQRLVDDSTYLLIEVNSEIFGELFFGCNRHITDETGRKEAFRAYQAMATCNGPVVRRHCAYNMPGVASSLTKRYRVDMAGIVEFLSRDGDAETRWNLAAGMHETAKVLCDSDTIDTLFKTVNTLLHDESPLVRMNVLRNLDNLLATLSGYNPLKASKRLESVFQNLQLLSEGNWRTQELLAKQMRLVASLVPPQCIRENVLPLLYQVADESSYTVRKAAMGAVAVCMRCIPDTTERDQVMESFRMQWARGKVFWMRIGFVDSAEVALETYSRILFRDTFGAELLRLAHDPVANIRIRVAQIMHKLAPACHQMDNYNLTLSLLQQDADKDVQLSLHDVGAKINDQLEHAQKTFERDMHREAEEQELYSKHLQLMAEAHKRRTAVRNKTNALLGALSPKGPASPQGNSSPFALSTASNSTTAGSPLAKAGGSVGSDVSDADSPRRQKLPRSATVSGRSGLSTSRLPRGATFSGSLKGITSPSGDPKSFATATGAKHANSKGNQPVDNSSSGGSRLPRSATVNSRLGRRPISGSKLGTQQALGDSSAHKIAPDRSQIHSNSRQGDSPGDKNDTNGFEINSMKATRNSRLGAKTSKTPRQVNTGTNPFR